MKKASIQFGQWVGGYDYFLQTFEAAFGFRLPGRRKILADFNGGPPHWLWAGAHSI